jgi:DNA-binding CsgD family transcriptional regulator
MISVGIISPDSLTLLGLCHLFNEQQDMQIMHASDSLLPLADTLLDFLVIDLDPLAELPPTLADGEGRRFSGTPRLIGIAGAGVRPEALAAAELSAVCRREDARRLLVDVVRRLYIQTDDAERARVVAAEVSLSRREEEVLRYLASGCTHDQVARRIGVSRHTVDTYVKRLRTKLRAGNKAQLVSAAWRMRTVNAVLARPLTK